MRIQLDRKMAEAKQIFFFKLSFLLYPSQSRPPKSDQPWGGTCRLLGPPARKSCLLPLKRQEKNLPGNGSRGRRSGRQRRRLRTRVRLRRRARGRVGGVKKGPAFQRQRRKMAATTGSGELGRRARPAKGARAWAGDRGPAKVLAAGPGPLRCICSLGSAVATRAA